MKLNKDGTFSVSPVFLFFKSIISERMKSTTDFFQLLNKVSRCNTNVKAALRI